MFKYFISMTALMVSVAGIGVSLAREEFRCYLGLASAACQSSENKSTSPTEVDAISDQKDTQNSDSNYQEKLEKKPTFNAKYSDGLREFSREDRNAPVRETFDSDSKFISVEELSRIPEKKPNVNLDNLVTSGEEGYVGIPIEVQPFNEGNN
ncbi:MAG: hypothetical protein AB4060_16605 [Crocosphaera sp.]